MTDSPRSQPIISEATTRREFLHYIWAASIILLVGEASAGVAWYMSAGDRPRKDTLIALDLAKIPKVGAPPIAHEPKLWLSNTPDGFFAFHDYCTHLGCQIKWVPTNTRFECPCHGAKFQANGTYISGPAGRNLDRYLVTVSTPYGRLKTPSDGGPVNLEGATSIEVDTLVPFSGEPRS